MPGWACRDEAREIFRSTAHLYDLIYESAGRDYAAEAADLDTLIRARQPKAVSLLDVACGTGAHLGHLRPSYEVMGIDKDPGMLEAARRRLGPEIALIEADMSSFSLGRRFDAVICLFSSIGYLRSTAELGSAVESMAEHLNPAGVLVLDGWVRPDAWRDPGSVLVQTAESDGTRVVRVTRSLREGRVTHLEMHHLVANPEKIEHLVDHHHLTLFRPEEYEAALKNAGLRFQVVSGPFPDRDRYVAFRI